MPNLLLIDDDTELTSLLSELLELEGFHVNTASNGQQGLELVSDDIDLILLDVMMPVLNGMETLRRLREQRQTPVLMLTAKGEEIDRVMGLELGADDYLPKPFSDRELLARIRAILRRTSQPKSTDTESSPEQDVIHYQDLTIYPKRLEVYCGDKLIALTGTETEMLICLVRHAGQVVPKTQLSEDVLGKRLAPFDRAIDMHISNIRKKLPILSGGRARIKTLRGKGYLLVEQ
ncbi:DNA-binding response regulator [Veronia nyctiphanis]|uniref:DNA-binding response regulator n=1 Tax=Veronia nyctiphanis TaxID=1278244 RepID=A0A4V1LT02_9GAMM|nr:response regulator [Veronia nyctiphanis]RXJ73488.1 DNA-binding response regulator [Veronia nyctiphanis]